LRYGVAPVAAIPGAFGSPLSKGEAFALGLSDRRLGTFQIMALAIDRRILMSTYPRSEGSQRDPASNPPGPADGTANGRGDRSPAQTIALVMSIVFLLVGVLGFIPGITQNFGTMSFASHHSEAMLLGLFQVSILHNIVHLLFGVVGLIAARAHRSAWQYLVIGGAVYLVLFIYGLVIDQSSAANFVPVNSADNWLHLALAAVMIVAGLATRRSRNPDRSY
jgi:hypothetical protein